MSALGQKVLDFAISNRGNQVEDGECWTLAERSLEHAGATTSSDLQNVARTVNYVWGDRIEAREAEPGDIIQFYDGFHYIRKVIQPNGDWQTDPPMIVRTHHTAIVEKVIDRGRRMLIIEQNSPPGSVVGSRECYFLTYSFPESGASVEITIKKKAYFYRPRPRGQARRRR